MAAGRRSNTFSTASESSASLTLPVPKVSTRTDTGEATPETIQDVYQNMDLPYHRGSVVWTEDLGDELDVETETAWNAMPEVFVFIISRLLLRFQQTHARFQAVFLFPVL